MTCSSVLIVTMDIFLNSLSFMVLLCLAQSAFPMLFANDTKLRIVFKLSPLIVDIRLHHRHPRPTSNPGVFSMICPTCSMHFLSLTILPFPSWSEHDHRAIAAAFVHRQNCTFRVSDFQIDIHAAARSVGEKNIALDAAMLHRFTQQTLQTHTVLFFSVGIDVAQSTGHVDTTLPESAIGRSSRHPAAQSTSPVSCSIQSVTLKIIILGRHRQIQLFDVSFPRHPVCADHSRMSLCSGSLDGSFFIYSSSK